MSEEETLEIVKRCLNAVNQISASNGLTDSGTFHSKEDGQNEHWQSSFLKTDGVSNHEKLHAHLCETVTDGGSPEVYNFLDAFHVVRMIRAELDGDSAAWDNCRFKVTNHHILNLIQYPYMCALCGVVYCVAVDLADHVLSAHPDIVKVGKDNKLPKEKMSETEKHSRDVIEKEDEAVIVAGNDDDYDDDHHHDDDRDDIQEENRSDEHNKIILNKDNFKELETHSQSLQDLDSHQEVPQMSESPALRLAKRNADTSLEDKIQTNQQTESNDTLSRLCSEIMSSNGKVLKNTSVLLSGQKYQCDICGKAFPSRRKYMLKEHLKMHDKKARMDPIHCPDCGKVFKDLPYLNMHRKSLHLEQFKDQLKSLCEICGKAFTTQSTVKKHKRLVHNTVKQFKCEFCEELFKTKQYLNLHLRRHTGEKPFKCQFCDMAFKSHLQLRLHVRSHTKEKPYTCNICGKSYASKSNHQMHMFTHTGERPHPCPQCNQTFKHSSSLKTHLKLHNGEKRYKCKFCDQKFTQSGNLVHHERIHTGEKPFVCDYCPERYARSNWLKHHMWKEHRVKINPIRGRPQKYSVTQTEATKQLPVTKQSLIIEEQIEELEVVFDDNIVEIEIK